MSLFRIIYVSDAVGAAGEALMPLIDIIGVSDRNNRRDHLTGVLMRHGGRFLQAIEGARVDLDRLMSKLAQDRRHANLSILSGRPIEARQFPDWAMARVDPSPQDAARMSDALAAPDAGAQAEALLIAASRALAADR